MVLALELGKQPVFGLSGGEDAEVAVHRKMNLRAAWRPPPTKMASWPSLLNHLLIVAGQHIFSSIIWVEQLGVEVALFIRRHASGSNWGLCGNISGDGPESGRRILLPRGQQFFVQVVCCQKVAMKALRAAVSGSCKQAKRSWTQG